MSSADKYDDYDEREYSERERKELLKKEAEELAAEIALKRARFRQFISDRILEKEIITLEKKWEHMRQKYERSLREIRRLEEEKAEKDHSAEQKKRLVDIDRELRELEEKNEKLKAGGWLNDPEKDASGNGASEKDPAEKDPAEKDAAEKAAAEKAAAEKDDAGKDAAGNDAPKKEKGFLDDVQERIKGIIGRKKPENEKSFAEMKNELKSAMADLIAKRVAFIDPNDPRENFIRGDRKNEEHYRLAYNKLMSGENKAFNRTIDDMGTYEDLKRIGSLSLTNKAGELMLYLGDRMKDEDIHIEARADRTKEKVLNADKELVLKPQDPSLRDN